MQPSKNKVLILTPFALPNLGGVESHIQKLMAYNVKRGLYPIVVTYQPLTRKVKGNRHELTDSFEIRRINWVGYNWFNFFEKYFLIQFLYLFPGMFVGGLFYYLKYRNDILCIHAHGLASAAAAKIIKVLTLNKVRVVISTHAVYKFGQHPILAFFIKHILSGCDVLLAVSDVSKAELEKLKVRVPEIKVHPNWIDTDIFIVKPKESLKNQLKMSYKTNYLFIGRLIDKKGVELFVQASKNLENCGFHMAGAGPMLEKVLLDTKAQPNFFYYGTLMQDDNEQLEKLVNLYNACDFLVSPYLYDEGFSTTLIEALACGTPSVITNRGSPPTFLTNKVAVFLSNEPTNEELTNTLNALNNGHNFSREECREYAIENFGFKNADVIIDSYGKV